MKAGTIVVNVDVADSEISVDGNVVAHGVLRRARAGGHARARRSPSAGTRHTRRTSSSTTASASSRTSPLQKERDTRAPAKHAARLDRRVLAAQLRRAVRGRPSPRTTSRRGSATRPIPPSARTPWAAASSTYASATASGSSASRGPSSSGTTTRTRQSTPPRRHPTTGHPGMAPRTESYDFHRVGGTAAIGVRAHAQDTGLPADPRRGRWRVAERISTTETVSTRDGSATGVTCRERRSSTSLRRS